FKLWPPPNGVEQAQLRRGPLGLPHADAARADAVRQRRDQAHAARARTLRHRTGPWPRMPHATARELGQVGDDIALRTLSWMWSTTRIEELFDTLVKHYADQQTRQYADTVKLPRRIDRDAVSCFGLLFTNASERGTGVIANITYGQPPAGAESFDLWDRG